MERKVFFNKVKAINFRDNLIEMELWESLSPIGWMGLVKLNISSPGRVNQKFN